MIKRIVRNLTPPIIYKVLSKIYHHIKTSDDKLFDGNDELFKSIIKKDDIYGEYGCGKSTLWVSKNFNIQIYSVESSIIWKNKVFKNIKNKEKCEIHHANIGEIGSWGRPKDYKNEKLFNNYTDWMWVQRFKPTVVLVDGRFRVCCFLTSLINGKEGDKIVFDDYNNRGFYHYVEKYTKPVDKFKRQSLFIIPKKEKLDIPKIKQSINNFRYVFD